MLPFSQYYMQLKYLTLFKTVSMYIYSHFCVFSNVYLFACSFSGLLLVRQPARAPSSPVCTRL